MTELPKASEIDGEHTPPPAWLPGILGMPQHPDRDGAIKEAHARPPLPIVVPAIVHHLAFATPDDTASALFETLFDDVSEGANRHTIRAVDGLTVKWERHTEFVSITLLGQDDGTLGENLLGRLRNRWPDGVTLLAAIRAFIGPEASLLDDRIAIGGHLRGATRVACTFRPGPDGWMDMHFRTKGAGAEQLGRRVQRVLEAEIYRTMALLGLPLARRINPELSALEAALADIVDTLSNGGATDNEILDSLQALSAKTESLRATVRYRFSASRAYGVLVEERLDSLHEEKVGERPTLSGFLRTRLAPALRTVTSSEARIEELSASTGRALQLLRARIEISLNRANQNILQSMNERQHRQLLLSQTVEGLSVIAITYYLLGIIAYPVKSLVEQDIIPTTEVVALGILAPFVAFGVFWTVRRIRAHILEEEGES